MKHRNKTHPATRGFRPVSFGKTASAPPSPQPLNDEPQTAMNDEPQPATADASIDSQSGEVV